MIQKNLESILERSVEQLKSNGRLIVTAITLQTISKSLDFFNARSDFEVESIQAQINRIERVKNFDMLKSENPIFILNAWKIFRKLV